MLPMRDAVLVVAHPDDEILWFSSILGECQRIIVCFGTSAGSDQSWDSGRAALIASYPMANASFLKLRESGAFEAADWKRPQESVSGLRLRRRAGPLYERNATDLRDILETELHGAKIVVTHNPWGEYGHEEHVQVFRVLEQLQDRMGFDLLVDSYVSNRSARLMSQHRLRGDPLVRATDRTLAEKLKIRYLEHNCWTWMDDYHWPGYEAFYRVSRAPAGCGPTAGPPVNYLTGEFEHSFLRKLAGRAVPARVRSYVRQARRG